MGNDGNARSRDQGISSAHQYKLESFVRKHNLTTMRARAILARSGDSRQKADAAAALANGK